MHDDHRGYDPSHYAEPFGRGPVSPPNIFLSAAQLRRLFGLLNSLDLHSVRFTGTLEFDGHSFAIGFDNEANEHFISFY